MIEIRYFVVWLSILYVSTQNNISKPNYNSFKRNSLVYENNLLPNDTRIKNKHPDISKLFEPKITEQCEEIGLCEDVPDYPEEHVEVILKQMERLNQTFNTDIMEEAPEEAGLRIHTDDFLELCDFVKKTIVPRAAKDINNEWYYIVNGQNKPQQKFQVEICKNQNGSCATVITFARSYRGWCHQKFFRRVMTAIDKRGKPFQGVFTVPSCCSCVYEAVNYIKK